MTCFMEQGSGYDELTTFKKGLEKVFTFLNQSRRSFAHFQLGLHYNISRSTSPTVYETSMETSKQSCDSKTPPSVQARELCRSILRTFTHSHRIYWDDILAVKEPKGRGKGRDQGPLRLCNAERWRQLKRLDLPFADDRA